MEFPDKGKVTDHLANERTFLAWVRTSIALMGFGFVIVKFAVFIRQMAFMIKDHSQIPNQKFSAFIGMLMILIGAFLAVAAYINYRKTETEIRNQQFHSRNWLTVSVTILLVVAGILMVWYLWNNVDV